jgi:hypothetical protein
MELERYNPNLFNVHPVHHVSTTASDLPQMVDLLNNWDPHHSWSLTKVAHLTQHQSALLHNWMTRLTRTPEFITHASRAQQTASSIVLTACMDADFLQVMVAQIQGNLEGCTDRTAMAFNELYTLWRLHTATELSPEDRLRLCVSLAKTSVLRANVALTVGCTESVERYLWVESTLSEELGLLSFAKTCYNDKIGKRGVDLDAVRCAVMHGWQKELFAMLESQPALFPTFPTALPQQDTKRYQTQLQSVEEFYNNESSAIYLARVNDLKHSWANDLLELRRVWLVAHLD